MNAQQTIRSRVYYAIRLQDVELAESFAVRCPEFNDVVELNTFFHKLLSQYPVDTHQLRLYLDDTMDIETWLRHFKVEILPFLRQNRLPANTSKNPVNPYAETISTGK